MSFPNGVRLSDSIASKLIEGGFPVDLDGLRFNAALNIWEFVPFGGGGGAAIINMGLVGNTAIATGFNSIFRGSIGIDGTETRVQSHMVRTVTMDDFHIQVVINNNTVDGAQVQNRINTIDGNIVIIFDQATGEFDDLVNTDVLAAGDEQSFQYEVGDASSTYRNLGIVMDYS